MTAPRLTRARLKAAGACYSAQKIARLVPRSGLTIQQVAALEIPIEDRAWALRYACAWEDAEAFARETYCTVVRSLREAGSGEGRYQAAEAARDARLVELARRGAVRLPL